MQAMFPEGFPFSQFNLTCLAVFRLALTRLGVNRPFYVSHGNVFLGCFWLGHVSRDLSRRLSSLPGRVSSGCVSPGWLSASVSPLLVALLMYLLVESLLAVSDLGLCLAKCILIVFTLALAYPSLSRLAVSFPALSRLVLSRLAMSRLELCVN